jgi:tetratricopeptide (TPR) repeat protein
VAQALIQTNENDLEGVNNQIAAHLEVAGEPRQAAHYYLQAAQAAANLYAYREAIDYLERAIGLVPEDTPKQAEIYAQEGNAYTALGDHDQAATKYTRAAEAASGSLEKVNYLCQCIRAMSAQTRHPEAETVYQAGMELLNHLPKTEWGTDRWAAWIRLQLAVLDSFYYQGKSHEMQDLCEMLVIPLDAYGAPRQHAEYLAFLVRTRFIENRYRATSEDIENKKAALEWAQQTADPNFILEFEFSLGFSLLWAGQVTDAIDKLEATSVKADVLGNIPLQNRCLTYLAIAQRMKGDPVRVQQTLMRVVSVAETEGYQVYLGVLEANWAWLAWQAGDWEALKKHGQSAQVYWKSSKNFYPFQWLLNFPLLAYEVGQGSLAGVCSYARALLDPHQQRLPDSISLVLESALQADSPETAVAHLKEATRFAQELGYL